MKKIIIIVFLIITVIGLGYVVFFQKFELFPDERAKLVEFNANGNIYEIYSFKGNPTVSSNIQLYRNEVMLDVFNTVDFYNKAKILERNDSTISLLVKNKKDDSQDTFRIKFVKLKSF
jgi:hypothetical protein